MKTIICIMSFFCISHAFSQTYESLLINPPQGYEFFFKSNDGEVYLEYSKVDRKNNDPEPEMEPLRLCRNKDNDSDETNDTFQPFTIRINEDESLGLVADGVIVEDGVVISNSSICINDPEKVVKISGDVEIYKSYIRGGEIISNPNEEEGEKDISKIHINESQLEGDFKIYEKVSFYKAKLKGGPTFQGNVGKGLNLNEVEMDYSDIDEDIKGLFGSAALYKVKMKGNIHINGIEIPSRYSKFQNLKSHVARLRKLPLKYHDSLVDYHINVFEVEKIEGEISISHKVSMYKGTYKGNFFIKGNRRNGVTITESNIQYDNTVNRGLEGDVDLYKTTINGAPQIKGIVPSSAIEDFNYQDNISYNIEIHNSTIKKNPSISGNINIFDSSTIDGNFTIEGAPVAYEDSPDVSTIINSSLTQTDLSKTSKISGWVRFFNSKVLGSPTITGDTTSHGITIEDDSLIRGEAKIKGRLSIRNADISSDSTIEFIPPVGSYDISRVEGWPGRIALTETNVIKGLFWIQKSLKNININAALIPFGFQGQYAVYISGEATLGENITLNGFVVIYSGSTVGSGVKIYGADAVVPNECSDCRGVVVNLSSSITGEETEIHGFVYLGGSSISGNSKLYLSSPTSDRRISRLHRTYVHNSTIAGAMYSEDMSFVGRYLSGIKWCTSYSPCDE